MELNKIAILVKTLYLKRYFIFILGNKYFPGKFQKHVGKNLKIIWTLKLFVFYTHHKNLNIVFTIWVVDKIQRTRKPNPCKNFNFIVVFKLFHCVLIAIWNKISNLNILMYNVVVQNYYFCIFLTENLLYPVIYTYHHHLVEFVLL